MNEKNKKKLIFVAVAVGRCGSSMVVGMLERAGVNAGVNPCHSKSVSNPGGFYETRGILKFLYDYYYDHMNAFKPMFSFEKLRDKDLLPKYLDILKHDYDDKYPMAVKALDYLPIAMFENEKDYDIRVVYVTRKLEDQAKSIRGMWSNKGPTYEWWCDWLKERYAWADIFRDEIKFPYLGVDFNDVLDHPREEAEKMLKFCDIEAKNLDEIEKWINPKYSRSRT